ncbi:unnamed protein product [Calypogeia fissa]
MKTSVALNTDGPHNVVHFQCTADAWEIQQLRKNICGRTLAVKHPWPLNMHNMHENIHDVLPMKSSTLPLSCCKDA